MYNISPDFIMKCLPYYKHGTKQYSNIWQRVQRNKKKYNIIVTNIPSRFLHMQRGTKYCAMCKNIKHMSEFYWKPDNRMFEPECKKCANKLSNITRGKNYNSNAKKWRNTQRLSLLKEIQDEVKCVRCGCDDFRLLEINHKNGGGRKELKEFQKYGRSVQELIRRGWRKTCDLELLCKPCNAIHYLEMKYGATN